MSFGLRARLSVMMFLQYFVWGIWLPMLAQRLGTNDLNLEASQIGWIFSVYGFGSIVGPFILGQLADRYFATERVMFVAHFVGGLLLFATAAATTFWPIFILLLLYCSLYMPTMGLSNSITFRSLGENNQNYFPAIRFWGTVGWIAAGLSFAAYLSLLKGVDIPLLGEPSYRDCLRLSGVFSIVLAIYSLTLPHTPPIPAKETDPVDKRSAVLECLELMRFRSFAVLVTIAGLIGIMLAFYFALENYFLEHIKVEPTQIGAYMTIGQFAEGICMLLVPLSVTKLGYKKTMLIGMAAWAIRFGFSALGYPFWLMIGTIALHGFAFGFFFVVAQMFVDRAAGSDIKASAQSLLIFVIYGLGTVLGSIVAGYVRGHYQTFVDGQLVAENWRGIWMGPFVLTLLCMVAFALLFKEEQIGEIQEEAEPVLAPSTSA